MEKLKKAMKKAIDFGGSLVQTLFFDGTGTRRLSGGLGFRPKTPP